MKTFCPAPMGNVRPCFSFQSEQTLNRLEQSDYIQEETKMNFSMNRQKNKSELQICKRREGGQPNQ